MILLGPYPEEAQPGWVLLQGAVCGWTAPHRVRGWPWSISHLCLHFKRGVYGPAFSGEAVPSTPLMFSARLGPLPCKSP